MKNTVKFVSVLASTLLLSASLIGCGNKKQSDPTTLNVLVLDQGYGSAWIQEVVNNWKADNPGYNVNLICDPNGKADGTIQTHIHRRNNTDDVYVSVGELWKEFANDGLFLPLNDLVEEKVDGIKIKDKLVDEYKDSINYISKSGAQNVYRLPWIQGAGGIFYNAKYFGSEAGQWTIPTTTEELINLCNEIVNVSPRACPTDGTKAVVPFVMTTESWDYFDYLVYSWWGQIAGETNIKDFFKYQDAGVFDTNSSAHPAYAGLKQATEIWHSIFSNPEYILRKTSKDYAQSAFINGEAAMMVNCEWLYNELGNYIKNKWSDYPWFELKLMETPRVSTVSGTAAHNSYIIGDDQFIAIPASTSKPELAKSFVKELVSDRTCKIFNSKASGFMAYRLSTGSYEATNSYMQSLLDYRSSLSFKFTNYSSSRIYLSNAADVWTSGANRPYESSINPDTSIRKSLNDLFEVIKNTALVQWGEWISQ